MSMRVAVWVTVLTETLVASGEEREQGALGSIAGIVDVRLPLSRVRGRPSVRELGTPSVRGRPDRAQSIVYLEMVPQGAFEVRPAGRAVLDQHQETFIPYALAVTVGTTVLFPNSDPIYHNVFSLSKSKRFDLGRYPQGRTKTVRFERPLPHERVHPRLFSSIFCVNGRVRALPDRRRASGRLRCIGVDRRKSSDESVGDGEGQRARRARFRGGVSH